MQRTLQILSISVMIVKKRYLIFCNAQKNTQTFIFFSFFLQNS